MNTDTKAVETVSQRVEKTRREIQQITAQIQKLDETGFKPPNPTFLDSFNPISLGNGNFQLEGRPKSPVNSAAKSLVNDNTQKSPATKSPVVNKKTVISKKPSEPQQNVPCYKKTKHYNAQDARDYMKKQREKRAKQLKAQTRTVDNTNDLKKEKLKELHKKSIDSVQKNLQLTRERSKSRDNASAIRLDRTSPRQNNVNIPTASNVRNEHTSRPRQQITNKPLQKPQSNLLKPPSVIRDKEIFEKTVYIPSKPENESPRICDNIRCDQPQIAQSEHGIMTDNCEKDTNETQTVSNKNKFINTVERKLQYAVNEPKRHAQDAAVQVKLDLKNVENLELKSPVKNKTVSKSLFENYDSESDTSINQVKFPESLSLEIYDNAFPPEFRNLSTIPEAVNENESIVPQLESDSPPKLTLQSSQRRLGPTPTGHVQVSTEEDESSVPVRPEFRAVCPQPLPRLRRQGASPSGDVQASASEDESSVPVRPEFRAVCPQPLPRLRRQGASPSGDVQASASEDESSVPVRPEFRAVCPQPLPRLRRQGASPSGDVQASASEDKSSGQHKYVCEVCRKGFRTPSHLNRHTLVHTGEKPFVCDICNKGFSQASSLKMHKFTHAEEKPFQCHICNKGFTRKARLERHLLTHAVNSC